MRYLIIVVFLTGCWDFDGNYTPKKENLTHINYTCVAGVKYYVAHNRIAPAFKAKNPPELILCDDTK